MNEITEWLRAIMREKNISQAALGRQLGYNRDVINKVLNNRRLLTAEELIRVAKYLGAPPPVGSVAAKPFDVEDTIKLDRLIRNIRCVGEVQGGVWRDMSHLDFDEFEIPYTADRRWPAGSVKALRVRGDSVNLKASDGDFVAVLDVGEAPRAFQDGDWVVVHRTRGDLVESTIKQVRRADEKWELWPASNDPRYQEPLALHTDGMNADDEVRVVGFVLDFIRQATRF